MLSSEGKGAFLHKGAPTSGRSIVRCRLTVYSTMLAIAVVLLIAGLFLRPANADDVVLKAAYEYPDGGGYCSLSETGVSTDIVFDGATILRKGKGGTYCSGFTFSVAMDAAHRKGLLKEKQAYQIARFQREWYGATADSRLKQVVTAMENLGIGQGVHVLDARPGDFVVFSTAQRTGHSVVFLDWVKQHDKIVGLKYRSSQRSSSGIGDRIEYFTTSGLLNASILPQYVFVARMNS